MEAEIKRLKAENARLSSTKKATPPVKRPPAIKPATKTPTSKSVSKPASKTASPFGNFLSKLPKAAPKGG